MVGTGHSMMEDSFADVDRCIAGVHVVAAVLDHMGSPMVAQDTGYMAVAHFELADYLVEAVRIFKILDTKRFVGKYLKTGL